MLDGGDAGGLGKGCEDVKEACDAFAAGWEAVREGVFNGAAREGVFTEVD